MSCSVESGVKYNKMIIIGNFKDHEAMSPARLWPVGSFFMKTKIVLSSIRTLEIIP